MADKNTLNRVWNFIKTYRKLAIVSTLAVLGIIFWQRQQAKDGVEQAVVTSGSVQEVLVLSGALKASEQATLRFPTSGKLAYVGITEGEEVKKGQVLAKLDTTSLYADLQKAESDLRNAEAALAVVYDAVKDHDDDESLTQKETRTAAEVAKDNAYRALTKAQFNLANATLTAPFDGFVTFLANSFTGINVLATEPQVEILNPETLYFEVAADQTEVINLQKGQQVEVILDSFGEKSLTGSVSNIALTPIQGEVGSVYRVKVNFGKQSMDLNQIKIGMTGDARFVLSTKDSVLKLPSSFIKADKEGRYVNLGQPDNKVYITVGVEGEEEAEVSGNIHEGDIVFD